MYKIAIVVPKESMVPLVESVIMQDATIDGKAANTPPYVCSVYAAYTVRDMPREVLDADVVLTRGIHFIERRKAYY